MSTDATKPESHEWDNRDNGGWGLEEMDSDRKKAWESSCVFIAV